MRHTCSACGSLAAQFWYVSELDTDTLVPYCFSCIYRCAVCAEVNVGNLAVIYYRITYRHNGHLYTQSTHRCKEHQICMTDPNNDEIVKRVFKPWTTDAALDVNENGLNSCQKPYNALVPRTLIENIVISARLATPDEEQVYSIMIE